MQYKIIGEPLPVVICDLASGESVITESGSMSWMTPNMRMETTSNGGVGKVFGRMLSGENLFQNRYTAQGQGQIAFASSFPGSIRPYHITPDNPLIVQKRGFLACESSVELSIYWQKRFGAGLFGGEGFVMQKLSGTGTAFIEIDGYACEYSLDAGQSMIVDTGYLAAMSSTCSIDITSVPGAKNIFFGGEGLFNTVVKGPGMLLLQTMPKYAVARSLSGYLTKNN